MVDVSDRRGDAPEASVFDSDTGCVPDGRARWRAALSDRWSVRAGVPNGGYLLATCVRALAGELPFPDPIAVSGHFLRPGRVGEAELATQVLRAGRRMAVADCLLSQDEQRALRVVATFADLGNPAGRTRLRNSPPELPAPERCVSATSGIELGGASIAEQVEIRFAELPAWRLGRSDDVADVAYWMRFADGRPTDVLALPLLVDAAPPVVWEIGEATSVTVELTVHVRARPAAGWLACRSRTRHRMSGYHEEDAEIWDSGGVLVAQSRQLAIV
ncbi:thioesterase family protein [Haloechinothrix sp. LS1_15]|uniref:thioesterase family protein n=1 Tax=Haloechinothrix sp. LS1_15 TaxID=2652248 RepID=UPI00294675E6|nr:thioesterase family protein [Haloechinothrix sp. LS1_15]MDV6010931.1 thioesterase family protein [Haloechinothrix sp. LS1_15]